MALNSWSLESSPFSWKLFRRIRVVRVFATTIKTVGALFAVYGVPALATSGAPEPALVIATDGGGSAAFVPFFSAARNESTLLSLSNLEGQRAVLAQLNLLDGETGAPTDRALVLLPPGALWVAALHSDAQGGPRLTLGGRAGCTRLGSAALALSASIAKSKGTIEVIGLATVDASQLEKGCEPVLQSLETDGPSTFQAREPSQSLTVDAGLLGEAGVYWPIPVVVFDNFTRWPHVPDATRRLSTPDAASDGKIPVVANGQMRTFESGLAAMQQLLSTSELSVDYDVSGARDPLNRLVFVRPFFTAESECVQARLAPLSREGRWLASPVPEHADLLDLCAPVQEHRLATPRTLLPEPGEGRLYLGFESATVVVGFSMQAISVSARGRIARTLPMARRAID